MTSSTLQISYCIIVICWLIYFVPIHFIFCMHRQFHRLSIFCNFMTSILRLFFAHLQLILMEVLWRFNMSDSLDPLTLIFHRINFPVFSCSLVTQLKTWKSSSNGFLIWHKSHVSAEHTVAVVCYPQSLVSFAFYIYNITSSSQKETTQGQKY